MDRKDPGMKNPDGRNMIIQPFQAENNVDNGSGHKGLGQKMPHRTFLRSVVFMMMGQLMKIFASQRDR